MLSVLIRIATSIPCWKYLCSTSFLIDRLMHRITQIQQLPQDLRNLFAREDFAREDFAHLSASSGHWSPAACSSQQQEQLSMSDVSHCVRSSRVMCRSLMPKTNAPVYMQSRNRNRTPPHPPSSCSDVISDYIPRSRYTRTIPPKITQYLHT